MANDLSKRIWANVFTANRSALRFARFGFFLQFIWWVGIATFSVDAHMEITHGGDHARWKEPVDEDTDIYFALADDEYPDAEAAAEDTALLLIGVRDRRNESTSEDQTSRKARPTSTMSIPDG